MLSGKGGVNVIVTCLPSVSGNWCDCSGNMSGKGGVNVVVTCCLPSVSGKGDVNVVVTCCQVKLM